MRATSATTSYEINIDRDQFMTFARANNATPSILVALLTSKALKKIHRDAEKPIVCSLASDMRNELGLVNTHKNCVSSLYLPYTGGLEGLTLKEQSTTYRQLIKEQKSPDAVRSAANSQIGMSDRLDSLETLAEKKQMLSFFDDFCINTFVISYLGQIHVSECGEHVESIHLYSSGNRGLVLNMLSAGDFISVDVLQSFESEQFVNEFMRSLDEIGLAYSTSGRIDFATALDRTSSTGGWHAEKYYAELVK
jgi:hypothetical protein